MKHPSCIAALMAGLSSAGPRGRMTRSIGIGRRGIPRRPTESHKIDLKVNLLDYKDASGKSPEVQPLIEPAALGWKGMHELFDKMAADSWIEALQVYRAAWQRDLTTPELDTLAAASSMMQRYENAYWIKEKVFWIVRDRLLARAQAHPDEKAAMQKLLADYIRAYYTGHFDDVLGIIGKIPPSER